MSTHAHLMSTLFSAPTFTSHTPFRSPTLPTGLCKHLPGSCGWSEDPKMWVLHIEASAQDGNLRKAVHVRTLSRDQGKGAHTWWQM